MPLVYQVGDITGPEPGGAQLLHAGVTTGCRKIFRYFVHGALESFFLPMYSIGRKFSSGTSEFLEIFGELLVRHAHHF
jgi:hypothetical protein